MGTGEEGWTLSSFLPSLRSCLEFVVVLGIKLVSGWAAPLCEVVLDYATFAEVSSVQGFSSLYSQFSLVE